MKLADTKIRNAKPKAKPYKLTDGQGLYLLVTPGGGKLWRIDYRFEGKRKTLALGSYPEISLLEARSRLLDARKALASGVDPALEKKALKQHEAGKDTFEAVAREWYEKNLHTWQESHSTTIKQRLEGYVFPWIGKLPAADINAPEVLRVLRRIESRGTLETARRVKIIIGQVLRYAVATGRADRDCTADLKGAIAPPKEKHMAAITDPQQFGALLRAIDAYPGSFIVKCALQFLTLTFVRPGELRHAEWQEIDFEAEQWSIKAEKMKMKAPHIVPLSRQALDLLKELRPLTGSGKYLFPSERTDQRPISENTLNVALRTMGYSKEQVCSHGFRATARTLLDEVLQQRIDLIEHQLAHKVRDPLGKAYNRTTHLPARREMMQLWADYLDGLRAEKKVLPLRKEA